MTDYSVLFDGDGCGCGSGAGDDGAAPATEGETAPDTDAEPMGEGTPE